MTSTDSTSAFGHQALDELPLLTALAPEARELVVASFVRARYEFGETLVAAGDAPDGFYVVCSGMARVLVAGRDGEEVSLNLLRAGDSFGEVGLLDGSPRTATVRAASDVEALRLDAAVFDALVRLHPEISDAFTLQSDARRLADFLRVHSAFSRLPGSAILPMLRQLETVELEPGELVVREGDPAGPLFIVRDGRLRAFQGSDGQHHDIRYLRTGDFFGELSLYAGVPRTASVEALEYCRLLALDERTFARLLAEHDEFRARIEERVKLYEQRRPAQVPLDFAELLPADAIEAALVEQEPDEEVNERGVSFDELSSVTAAPDDEVRHPAKRRPWSRRRPRFPYVRQIDEMDCGAACVAMVCRHFGREVAPSHIRMAVGTGVDGTSLRGLQRGGEHVGLRCVRSRRPRSESSGAAAAGDHPLGRQPLGRPLRGRRRRVYLADPGRGRRRVGRGEILEQNWSGYAALPTPTPRLAEAPLGQRERTLAGRVHPPAPAGARCSALAPRVRRGRPGDAVPRADPAGRRPRAGAAQLHAPVRPHRRDGGPARALAARHDGPAADAQRGSRWRSTCRRSTTSPGACSSLPMSYFETRRTGDIDRRLDGVRQIRRHGGPGRARRRSPRRRSSLVAVVIMFIYSPLDGRLFLLTASRSTRC